MSDACKYQQLTTKLNKLKKDIQLQIGDQNYPLNNYMSPYKIKDHYYGLNLAIDEYIKSQNIFDQVRRKGWFDNF